MQRTGAAARVHRATSPTSSRRTRRWWRVRCWRCRLRRRLARRSRSARAGAGTPPRSAPVIQTQIILAIVGAVVMLIVGSSLARAFGIVGVASLIRYRRED